MGYTSPNASVRLSAVCIFIVIKNSGDLAQYGHYIALGSL